MEERIKHRVVAKVAVYSPDGQSVLSNNISSLGHGLPGGHLEDNEDPLDCLKREVLEELGIDDLYGFELEASWWHEDRKLVLGYTSKRDTVELPPAPHPQIEFGEWLEIKSISEKTIGSYVNFIKKFQPKQ